MSMHPMVSVPLSSYAQKGQKIRLPKRIQSVIIELFVASKFKIVKRGQRRHPCRRDY